MQASQRASCNHALEYAVLRANELRQPVVVVFGLTEDYPQANERHYAFMLEGLAETARGLQRRGIRFVVRLGSPPDVCLEQAADASLVVCDRGYLKHQRLWRKSVARKAPCRTVQVETDVVVPADDASDKEEYAARTIRPKLTRKWPQYLVPLEETSVKRDSLGFKFDSIRPEVLERILESMRVDRGVPRVSCYVGGTSRAMELLREFISNKLRNYATEGNDPALNVQSHMSPYLHFGQISPLQIALAIRAAGGAARKNKEAYLEQLLVRRELSVNFVLFNARYESYECLPNWARATLKAHQRDKREHVYGREQLEACRTHDPYWNAAMREMILTGKMHGYMRMYWGKKILEWSRSPRTAFKLMLDLNNKYFLDGRDVNSYAGVAWCFGKHDRPWGRREVFGTVRTMTATGLERKFDIAGYVQRISSLRDP